MNGSKHSLDNLSESEKTLDVLVVGGGPVGLITAYQLSRNLPSASSRIRIIEKESKSSQDQYGRAITLFPRSSELLDQLGLADELAQQCFACRSTVSYDASGNEVHGRGWHFMESMTDTAWDFALVLRQKYQEDIFRRALKANGIELESNMELVALQLDESIPVGDGRITAHIKDIRNSEIEVVKCKYLVGADGGRSFVRRTMGVAFEGSSSEDKWVRIDGVVETDLPKPRTYCAIESPTHGNVLWAALDHGATRIGYAFTAERAKAYVEFDEEAAVKEAVAAVKPFSLDFKQVDWWTIYIVGQRVAKSFSAGDCVFLAGDACHTHSSGAAQGMNTGLHDAVNLGWKLSLVLNGFANPQLLLSYEAERRPNVEKLIRYDKDIARLMTMQLPKTWTGDPKADPNEILGVVMKEAATFSSGLGIFYKQDGVLNAKGSFEGSSKRGSAAPGERVPDVPLQKPATFEGTRVHKVTPNVGKFHILIFAGEATASRGHLPCFTRALFRTSLHEQPWLQFLIVLKTVGPSAYEILGVDPTFAKVLYDNTGKAHQTYGVDLSEGAIFVLRPDGWIGTAMQLREDAVGELEAYFRAFMITT
jgi:phenol 2-monooxygenase